MEISVTDFSAPIGASVFKFCVHLQEGKVYCVNGNLDAYPHFAFFFQFFIFSFFHSKTYIIHIDIFFCQKNKHIATYCLSVPLFVHFSFSPMEISVTDFSAPIGASVFKFCVHLQEGKVYCENGNLYANPHFAFFFQFFIFSFFHSYIN